MAKSVAEWERRRGARTLSCFLQALQGTSVVVELKDYTAIQGMPP